MTKDAVAVVRRFNRTVGEAIGLTGDRFLGRKRPPGESRLLWEVGDGIELRALRRRLRLDSGYLTRALQALARQGLVTVRASAEDRRQRHVLLTRRGLAERARLDQRSDSVAESILEPLDAGHRQRLLEAMSDVERLLAASMIRFVAADPKSADAEECLTHYFRELDERFSAGFDPARSISADARELVPPRGLLLLAYSGERPAGCGALKFHGTGPAEVKRMWIAPAYRGVGVGARLLAELERRAAAAGARRVRLETNGALLEAIALYRKSGWIEVDPFNDEPYAHHWFEKRLPPAPKRHPRRTALRTS